MLLVSILWLLTGCVGADGLVIHTPPDANGSSADSPLDLAAIAQAPATNPIQNDVFYFVMPDRFANGSTDNDLGELSGDRLVTGFDPTNSGFYHGGDLAGLTTKLDYLDQMGITAIWMTPLFKNKMVQGSGANASASYHGYWNTDYTQINLASQRNRKHIASGKAFFQTATLNEADFDKERFDKIFAVRVNLFAKQPAKQLEILKRQLKPGGTLYLFDQPPVASKSQKLVESVSKTLLDHGFSIQEVLSKELESVRATCVIAKIS